MVGFCAERDRIAILGEDQLAARGQVATERQRGREAQRQHVAGQRVAVAVRVVPLQRVPAAQQHAPGVRQIDVSDGEGVSPRRGR